VSFSVFFPPPIDEQIKENQSTQTKEKEFNFYRHSVY